MAHFRLAGAVRLATGALRNVYMLLCGSLDSARAFRSHHRLVRFAVSMLPGWHTTIFPPYFVAGAIFSGFEWL